MKLGLIEGQTYDNLSLDLNDLIKKNDELERSFGLNESLNGSFTGSSHEKGFKSIFNSNKISSNSVENLKSSLINNYWEFN